MIMSNLVYVEGNMFLVTFHYDWWVFSENRQELVTLTCNTWYVSGFLCFMLDVAKVWLEIIYLD